MLSLANDRLRDRKIKADWQLCVDSRRSPPSAFGQLNFKLHEAEAAKANVTI